MRAHQPRRKVTTIWTQVLFIALVPSVAVMLVGAAAATYLVNQGIQISGFASDVRGALDPISRFVAGIQEERRLTMERATDQGSSQAELETQRRRVDEVMAAMETTGNRLAANAGPDLRVALTKLAEARHGLPATRQQIDTGVVDAWKAYHLYNDLLDLCGATIQGIAKSASDAEVSFEQMISYDLFKSAEAMSRSHSMAVRAVALGLDATQFHELAHQLGMYHEQVESVVPRLTQPEKDTYAALKQTPGWTTLVSNDNSLMNRGPVKAAVNFDVPKWEGAARSVGDSLMGLYVSHSRHAADLAADRGRKTFLMSIIGGGAILLIAAAALIIALRLSRRLVRRLRALREHTLDLAHNALPQIVTTIREGRELDLEQQVGWLDHGGDEIGQVADAFNEAQRTAIGAAVREAETRQGVRQVFLNIARRSQVIVHRQLKVLDSAERKVEDPDQLQLLFQLDHLATRSRRNAENLIILGGEQPGRQWRNPVSLRDIVRSAIAETEHYTRVGTSAIPEVSIAGQAVADIVHLLAELIDNGTAFSPAESRVEIRGSVVGRGVVVEVEDQGLGIADQQRDALNAMLRNPPDFNVMALSAESRVGLFVVARLAARHGIKISLRESDYGGTRAIVLLSNRLVANRGRDAVPPEASAPMPVPAAVSVDVPLQARSRSEPPHHTNGVQPAKPALPKRERQASIAPQLMTTDAPSELPAEPQAINEDESLRRSERMRRTMSAFQQGTRRGRGYDGEIGRH
jgi:signal transduction histidine kinase